MMRHLVAVLFLCFVFTPATASAATPVLIEVFEREDCGHCQSLRSFLAQFSQESDIEIRSYDVRTREGEADFRRVTEKAGLPRSTPLVLIGTGVIQGFDVPETTGQTIRDRVAREEGQPRIGLERYLSLETGEITRSTNGCDADQETCALPLPDPVLVKLPFLGPTDVSEFSLPFLAAVLGFVDGFNPCAMWVLVTFLVVLLQVGSRERMILIAGLFIVAETVMYYLILNVWFTTWDFVGLDRYVTPVVGLLALGGGVFFLYEWYRADGTCKVTNSEQRSKISSQVRKLASEPFTWLSAAGVIMLALSVNVIEFACSIGIPQAFTKIIELNELSFFGSQSLMFVYILFYMVDDFIVFGLALWGAERLHLTTTYARWCNLFGGLLMLLLGSLLVFAPEILRAL